MKRAIQQAAIPKNKKLQNRELQDSNLWGISPIWFRVRRLNHSAKFASYKKGVSMLFCWGVFVLGNYPEYFSDALGMTKAWGRSTLLPTSTPPVITSGKPRFFWTQQSFFFLVPKRSKMKNLHPQSITTFIQWWNHLFPFRIEGLSTIWLSQYWDRRLLENPQ